MAEKKAEKEVLKQAVFFEEKVKNELCIDSNIRFAEFIDRWLTDYAEPNLKVRTVAHYRDYSKRIIESLGHVRLDRIKPMMLISFYNQLQEPIRENTYRIKRPLTEVMEKSGFTLESLSKEAGVSIYKLRCLKKKEPVTRKIAQGIAEAVGIPLNTLFEKEIREHTLSPKTIQNYHRLISSILSTAVDWQVIPYNPADRVSVPKAPRKEAAYLEEEDVVRLLDELQKEDVQFRAAITTLLFTGMRRGELLGLQWKDIDFSHKLISIERSALYEPGKGIYIDTPKTQGSIRTIRIPEAVLTVLGEWKEEQRLIREYDPENWVDNDWVFTRVDGQLLYPDYLSERFRKFVVKAGLPPVHLHSLRHTNASLLIANGTNIQTVASRLGHASTNVTGQIYSHAIRRADAAASDMLEQLLLGRYPETSEEGGE